MQSSSLPFVRIFPFSVDNSERNIFVRWPSSESKQHCILVTRFLDYGVARRFRFVYKIRIEYVELDEALCSGR
jgi:hypothetical protein